MFVGLKTLKVGVADVVASFSKGTINKHHVLESFWLKSGEHCTKTMKSFEWRKKWMNSPEKYLKRLVKQNGENEPEKATIAVSYTHLDVYKRQHLQQRFLINNASNKAFSQYGLRFPSVSTLLAECVYVTTKWKTEIHAHKMIFRLTQNRILESFISLNIIISLPPGLFPIFALIGQIPFCMLLTTCFAS